MSWDSKKDRFTEGLALGLFRLMISLCKSGELFKKKFRGSEMSFFPHAFLLIGTRFPQLVASLFGLEWIYYESVEEFGENTWWAPHNLYRHPFHFAFGMSIIGVPVGIYNEYVDGWVGIKTLLDLAAFISGGFYSVYLLTGFI